MKLLTLGRRSYRVDDGGFLLDPQQWNEAFAEGLAPLLKITRLTDKHWKVIHFIRDAYRHYGKCPLVYETCRENDLRLKDLERLFPTGYQRGACKLAGLSYKMAYPEFVLIPAGTASESAIPRAAQENISEVDEKIYRVDVRGFLLDPNEWDEQFAIFKAYEMGLRDSLTTWHWDIIYFLRNSFKKTGIVPTVYEACEAHHLEIEDLERLFPNGYHRGAVKIAGLRV